MLLTGLPPFNPLKKTHGERKTLPASTPVVKPGQAYLQAEAAADAAHAAARFSYSQSSGTSTDWYLPPIENCPPNQLGHLYAIIESAATDPARVAKAKFTGSDASHITTVDDYLTIIRRKLEAQFSSEA